MAPSRAALSALRRCAYSPSSGPSNCIHNRTLIHTQASIHTSSPAQICNSIRPRIAGQSLRLQYAKSQKRALSENSILPRILQPSLWKSLVPRFLRRSKTPDPNSAHPPQSQADALSNSTSISEGETQTESAEEQLRQIQWEEKKARRRETNLYIILSLLIGSQAIQMLTLRRNYSEFSRETEARLEVLREVVRRVQEGEDVDIAKELGTGIEKEERAWEDVIRELEEEDSLIRERKRRKRAANGTSGTPGTLGSGGMGRGDEQGKGDYEGGKGRGLFSRLMGSS